MKKYFPIATATVFALVAGYGLGRFLRRSDSAPLPGFQSRVVDSIPGKVIVEFFCTRESPGRRLRYIRDDKGTRPLTLAELSWYVEAKHGSDPEARESATRDLIALHNLHETVVLSSAQDIPGFSPDQLDPDLRDLSLTRRDTQDPKNAIATISIVYAWTRVGGVLKRYRFKTHKGHAPYCYSCITLQCELGDAVYLE